LSIEPRSRIRIRDRRHSRWQRKQSDERPQYRKALAQSVKTTNGSHEGLSRLPHLKQGLVRVEVSKVTVSASAQSAPRGQRADLLAAAVALATTALAAAPAPAVALTAAALAFAFAFAFAFAAAALTFAAFAFAFAASNQQLLFEGQYAHYDSPKEVD
jgi:hypothetical protein